jgi:hypothetical protein
MKHIRWNDIPYEHVNEHFRRKLAWDGKLMIALTEVDKGYVVPPREDWLTGEDAYLRGDAAR